MTRAGRLCRRLRRFAQAEHGSVTLDFVLMLPIVLTVLMASFEAGYVMLRMVMMERALDITVRDLRVGALGATPTHGAVRNRFCEQATLLPSCATELILQMQVINRNAWTGFNTEAPCIDRETMIEPPLQFSQGGTNEIVTVRACAVFEPFFPTTKWGLRLDRHDAFGGYTLASMSAFVNEPR